LVPILINDVARKVLQQAPFAEWALCIGTHMMQIAAPEYLEDEIIANGYNKILLCRDGKTRMNEVRQSGFEIHQMAKECADNGNKLDLRVVGHVVATGHI